jgi:hypothetical protein
VLPQLLVVVAHRLAEARQCGADAHCAVVLQGGRVSGRQAGRQAGGMMSS